MKRLVHINRGFLVLDCLIGVTLLLLLIWGGIMSWASIRDAQILRREVRKFNASLKELALKALQEEVDQTININHGSYSMNSTVHVLPSPIELHSHSTLPKTITFYSSGVTTPITIEIRNGVHSCKITLSLRGRITEQC